MGKTKAAVHAGPTPSRASKARGLEGAKSITPGIAASLFGVTRQRVLGLLFGQPERSFFAAELIALAGAGSGGVQRELARLVASGLVSVTPVGRQKHYRANAKAPVFDELRALIVKTVGFATPLRSALEPLANTIQLALVYGSVARGEDGAQSDIDLLIVSDTLTLEDLYGVLSAAEARLSRPIHPTLYTSKEFSQRRKAKNAFLEKILNREHHVLIGGIDDIAPR